MADTNVNGNSTTEAENVESTMADKVVFGKRIDLDLLMRIPEYANKVRMDKSVLAMERRARDGNYDAAVACVNELAKKYNRTATRCLLYNGTGEQLRYHASHDWKGNIDDSGYPQVIENGQWAAFLHVKDSVDISGSSAAVVYRGKNKYGKATDWMLAWHSPTPTKATKEEMAYVEINQAGRFDNVNWNQMRWAFRRAGDLWYREEWEGCDAEVRTFREPSPLWTAVLSLK